MDITALQPFIHGALNMRRGDRTNISDALAKDLAAANLVAIDSKKQAPTLENKMALATTNKAKSK
jgi:hypothetical protein